MSGIRPSRRDSAIIRLSAFPHHRRESNPALSRTSGAFGRPGRSGGLYAQRAERHDVHQAWSPPMVGTKRPLAFAGKSRASRAETHQGSDLGLVAWCGCEGATFKSRSP